MKIGSYENDNNISLNDKVMGIDADDANKNKNYTFQKIKDFLIAQGLGGAGSVDISGKVDKVTGKSLISDTEITRLAGISASTTKVSQQVVASSSTPPDIKLLNFIRISSSGVGKSILLSGTNVVGVEYYVKNTSSYTVNLIGDGENINETSALIMPAGSYWHLIKEDGGTNSITAFKLSLT